MKLFIKLFKLLVNIKYNLLKGFLRKKNRIVFLSRQSDHLSDDFKMIMAGLKGYDIKYICIRDDGDIISKIKLIIYSLKSITILAGSKVCVLDSYWPGVSLLKNKNFKVIQIWHALGKIKKSGYQTLDKSSGRDLKTSKAMDMHRNYDIVVAGGKAWNKYYCESFNIDEGIIRNYGLPRIDRMLDNKGKYINEVYEKYPELSSKPILLYAPTFRRGYYADWYDLLDEIDTDKFHLVIKAHPNSPLDFDTSKFYNCNDVTTEMLLAACEYLITDYSAIAIEGALLDKKTYYYIFDYEEYISSNGLNLLINEEYPKLCFKDAKSLANQLNKGEYPYEVFENYKERFLPSELGNSTKKIIEMIEAYMKE
jgi:CDP-ribitol ribitolphosphotransferase